MDSYNVLTDEDADIDLVISNLIAYKSTIFSYSTDQITAYIITITTEFSKIGSLPWSGNPIGKWLIGLYGHGLFHFSPIAELHPNYFAEKMNCNEFTAKQVSPFLNKIFKKWQDGVIGD